MSFLKKIDQFGPKLGLNFAGEESFQTHRGGLISLLISIVVCIQITELFSQLWTQEDPAYQLYNLTDNQETPLDLSELGQAYFFTMMDEKPDGTVENALITLDPRIGTLSVTLRYVDLSK